jgi:hypothetical protein
VAGDTLVHREIVFLNDRRHLPHIAMTRVAGESMVDMHAVIEEHMVGKVMHTNPFERFLIAPTCAHGRENIRGRPNRRVTSHARRGVWKAGAWRTIHTRVTKSAIEAKTLHMVFVTELQRLLDFKIPTRRIRGM